MRKKRLRTMRRSGDKETVGEGVWRQRGMAAAVKEQSLSTRERESMKRKMQVSILSTIKIHHCEAAQRGAQRWIEERLTRHNAAFQSMSG